LAYYNEDQLKKFFEDAIQKDANKKIGQLTKEINRLYQREMKKIKDDLEMKADLQLQKDMRDVRIEYQDQINQIGAGFDEKLIKERTFIVDIIFHNVLVRLGDYIQTEAYDQAMTERLQALQAFVKDKRVVFHVATVDERIADVIEKTMTTAYEIVYSQDIHLGGFLARIPSDSVEVDETLDEKLRERKAWFYQNSQLFTRI